MIESNVCIDLIRKYEMIIDRPRVYQYHADMTYDERVELQKRIMKDRHKNTRTCCHE